MKSLKQYVATRLKRDIGESVEQIDETKLVGIMRHPEHGKAYIWHKGGEGGYNYEVEHTKTKKKETHNKSHEDVVAHLKKQGYKMHEEVEQVDEGIVSSVKKGIKNVKRGLKGWGTFEKDSPKELVKRNKAHDDSTVKLLHKGGPVTKGSPADLQKRVLDREMKKRNLGEEEVEQVDEVAAWQRKEGKSESGGLNRKGIESYRRENPGSKLSMAVTTKPSKLKPGSKAANRRKSFCSRMTGLKKRLTSRKTARDPNSRVNKALRKWNC